MPNHRRTLLRTPAFELPDPSSDIIFNLEPGAVVEVLSEYDPTYTNATHLGHAVYIRREDTVQASPEEIALIQPDQPSEASLASAPSAFCPHCGATVDAGARFCKTCGGSLMATAMTTGELAPFWHRFGALMLDAVLLWTATIFLAVFLLSFTAGESASALGWLFFLGPAAYYVIGYSIGRTLGCAAVGLRIETEDGAEPGFGRGLIRWFISIFSGLALGLGYFWMIWDPQKQTWHDKAAGTVVVKR